MRTDVAGTPFTLVSTASSCLFYCDAFNRCNSSSNLDGVSEEVITIVKSYPSTGSVLLSFMFVSTPSVTLFSKVKQVQVTSYRASKLHYFFTRYYLGHVQIIESLFLFLSKLYTGRHAYVKMSTHISVDDAIFNGR